MNSVDELLRFDREHLWHPFTSMKDPLPVQLVESAQGCRLQLAGRSVLDGMSSWWCAVHGYRHPQLDAALRDQIDSMSHVMFGGLTHRPAIELGRRLLEMVPPGLQQVFFCDSGSVAVEVGMKMALQTWMARGRPEKKRLLTLRGGYHGDTFATMAVCDPDNGMHQHFGAVLREAVFVPRPSCRFGATWDPGDLVELEQTLRTEAASLAAVVLEPIVQGAGGMWFYHPEYLSQVRQLCDEHQVLLICDEIATGFGRTGRLFACEHADIRPDILCLGKALTGGTLSLAATLCTADIADAISSGEPSNLMHGPTFMANPLATAAATASLDLLEGSTDWQRNVPRIEAVLREGLEECRSHAAVRDVRVLGAIGVLEMEAPVDVARTQAKLLDRGVWLRPFGRLLSTMPPYVMADEDLQTIVRAMVELSRAG